MHRVLLPSATACRRTLTHVEGTARALAGVRFAPIDPDSLLGLGPWVFAPQANASSMQVSWSSRPVLSSGLLTSVCSAPTVGRWGGGPARWRTDILVYFDHSGASNGPIEAINGRLEHLRGIVQGFRNLTHYMANSLIHARGLTLKPEEPSVVRSEPPSLCLRGAHEVWGATEGEVVEEGLEGELRSVRGARLSLQCGHDGGGSQVELVEEKDVGTLNLDVAWFESVWWVVLDVLGDDDVGTAHDGGCHDVTVVWIGQTDGWFQRLPAGH